jgi:glycosyltransferase involved in cell wall biosynthesis
MLIGAATGVLSNMSRLRIAMIAPPWLTIPPSGYGGIEAVLDGLLEGLSKLDVDVELFSIHGTKVPKGIKLHTFYQNEQFNHIQRPFYESLPILGAHIQNAINYIRADGNFDIIHDHTNFLGPQLLAQATIDFGLPPAVHTLHGPPFSNEQMLSQGLPDNKPFWDQLGKNSGHLYMVGISDALMQLAPKSLQHAILPTVYNAIDVSHFPFVGEKKDYFMTLARFSRDKGQHTAVKICMALGYRLRMAGTVSGICTNRRLLLELANPLSNYRQTDDFRYYSDEVWPLTVRSRKITYVGNMVGKRKMTFISEAKALLFPIDWDEPFGMAVIEALACGTPVIAMNRGAMPEIIQHGYNGFLANNEQEFAEYMRRVDEINPEDCRQSVEEFFSADAMAKAYVERYKEAIRRTKLAKKQSKKR